MVPAPALSAVRDRRRARPRCRPRRGPGK